MEDLNDKLTIELRKTLLDYQLLQGRVKKLELDRKRLLAGPKGIAPIDLSGMPKGSTSRNVQYDINKLFILNGEIDAVTEELATYDEIFKAIDTGKPNSIYSRVLKGTFLQAKTVAQMAAELNVSTVTLCSYKKQAMYNFAVIYFGKDYIEKLKKAK